MKLQIYGKSVKGKDHKENEDAFLINKRKNLFAVADGVSNPPGGREAAIKSLNYLNKFFKNNLHEAIKKTNIKIIEEKKKNPKIGYTTLTAVNIKNNNLEMAHIGDSSLFLIEENKIKKLTVSQSYFGILTQVLGMESISPQIDEIKLKENSILLLCTDGITSVIKDEELLEMAMAYKKIKEIVEGIIRKANEKPQSYNDDKTIIAILVR